MVRFKVKFTEIEEITATSRENAMTIFYGRNPTLYVISVVELNVP